MELGLRDNMEKSNLFITLLLLSLAVITLVCTDQAHDEDYIDPMDLFNFDPINMRMKKESDEVTTNKAPQPGFTQTDSPTTNSEPKDESDSVAKEMFTQKTESCSADTKLSTVAISLLRQYAMILVNNLESKDISNTRSDINLRLRVSRHEIYKLKQFGQEKTTDIHDIHDILRYIIQYASDVLPPESNLHWLESRMGLSWPMMLQILATIICFIALLRVLQQTLITQRLIFQMLFLLFVISVIFAWAEMYQEKLADQERQLMETLGKACQKAEDQSFFNRAFLFVSSQFTFKSDKCQEYYQNIFVNPVLKVSPMEALAVAVVKTLVAPVGIIGRAISTFLTELLKDLPVHYQLAVSCVLPLLVIIVLCIWRGYQLNLFHLVSIGPGHQPAPMPISHGHHPAPVQAQHTVAPAVASIPASSQVHQIQCGSLYSVHGTQPDERVPRLPAAKMQSLNSAKHVTKRQDWLQQRSQAHNEKQLEPDESDPIAGGEPGPGQIPHQPRDEDHEDIRQRLADVKITPAAEFKQEEVENQLQKLVISENQPIQTETSFKELSAEAVVKESDDMKQSNEEKSMTEGLQEEKTSVDESIPSTAESIFNENQFMNTSLKCGESNDDTNFDDGRKKMIKESAINVGVPTQPMDQTHGPGATTSASDARETTQESSGADEDFVVVKEDDFVFQEAKLHIKMEM
ncbi:unnamed protein product [Lymnaea stagnalis]|uniref:Chloride channel CLIC-like protein 1 n=1 Tax=Lymnaea stagnalis TaxID=6523 RepID=A0AAV2HRX2_LYMST